MKKILLMIPAYNEEELLEKNINSLHNFFKKNIRNYKLEILISDNNSKDKTLEIAKRLSKKYKEVDFVHLQTRPKSNSIKKAWLSKDADIYMYMDADLSTDISHLPELIQGIEQGYDITTGSRVLRESGVSRNFIRRIVSETLKTILKILFSVKIHDFQCGFKAINKKVKEQVLPKMKALKHGFMDTEMLIVSHNKGYKIKEFPVRWEDTRKSKVQFFKDILDTSKNILRIKFDIITGKYG